MAPRKELVPKQHKSAILAQQQEELEAQVSPLCKHAHNPIIKPFNFFPISPISSQSQATPARKIMLEQERERVVQLYRQQRKRQAFHEHAKTLEDDDSDAADDD